MDWPEPSVYCTSGINFSIGYVSPLVFPSFTHYVDMAGLSKTQICRSRSNRLSLDWHIVGRSAVTCCFLTTADVAN